MPLSYSKPGISSNRTNSQTKTGGNKNSSNGVVIGGSSTSASFLDKNMNDPAVLRKMVSELEAENKRLK